MTTIRIIEHPDCLPRVKYRGRVYHVRGTQYGARRDGGGKWGKLLLLHDGRNSQWVHQDWVQPCAEEPEPEPEIAVSTGGSAQRIRLVKT